MGIIHIQVTGSFYPDGKSFGPAKNGHANLVAEAIQWLSEITLPNAIDLDHDLHTKGHEPDEGWRRK